MKLLAIIQLITCVFLFAFAYVQESLAQEEKQDAPRRRRRRKPLASPETHPDRTITFRLKAPNAGKVALAGISKGDNAASILQMI